MVEFLSRFADDLPQYTARYGMWIYLVLFLVLFAETGFAVPFLPGDSLLFGAGVLAHSSRGTLSVGLLFLAFVTGAFAGDNVNYRFGATVGRRLFRNPSSRFFKPSKLDRAHAFYERHGARAVILARFFPIARNLAPFVAGMGRMEWRHFVRHSFVGCLLWVGLFLFGGLWFSQIPAVSEHPGWAFALVLSICAAILIHEWRQWRREAAHPDSTVPVLTTESEECV